MSRARPKYHGVIPEPALLQSQGLRLKEIVGVMNALSSDEARRDLAFNQQVDSMEGFFRAFEDLLIERGEIQLLEEGRLLPEIKNAAIGIQDEILQAKSYWAVPRPYVESQAIAEVLPFKSQTADTYAYPSGHAAQAYFLASYLCHRITQDYCSSLFRLAYRIGYGRVRIGVHYPQDFYAGRKLGLHLANLENMGELS